MAKSKARKLPEEKELLDKCDGLATAAGSARQSYYNIQHILVISSAWNYPPRTGGVQLVVVA